MPITFAIYDDESKQKTPKKFDQDKLKSKHKSASKYAKMIAIESGSDLLYEDEVVDENDDSPFLFATNKNPYVIAWNCMSDEIHGNLPLCMTILKAYNKEKGLVLSPDIIMMLVQFNFNIFVTKFKDELKDQLVNFSGEKITVYVEDNHFRGEEYWDSFFGQMTEKIKKHVKDGLVDILECDFTTTTPQLKMISQAGLMGIFKHYIEYERGVPECGIRTVRLQGVKEDWIKVKEKVQSLSKFEGFKEYTIGMTNILDKFIDAFDGNYHKDWWDKIVNEEDGSAGSGYVTYITGWILDFFYGLDRTKKVELEDLYLPDISFKVKVINKATGQTHNVAMVVTLEGYSISEIDEIKPVISAWVVKKKD